LIVSFRKQLFTALVLPGLLCAFASVAFGQSSNPSLPTPVLANDINGRIAALDLGDSRSTRHYYALEGAPGDLLITIDSKNLNGDMDVFTAVTFRPLMKTTLYASSQSGEVTKGLYLRTRQILILRVEARTPNDEAGTYHVRFGGTFAPFSGGIPVAENTEAQEDRASRDSKRLSSVGATIAQPVIETPPPVETKAVAENEKPAEETATDKKTPAPKSAKTRPAKPPPVARNPRGRARPTKPKPTTSDAEAAKTAAAKTEEAKTAAAKTEETKAEEVRKETAPAEEKSAATTSEKTEAAKPRTQELPLPGAHLIIESKDGTRIDRPMSTVRRVVVEGGTIVIVLKTGKIERIPMSTVARMAIEP
jgi:hypothetical protein